MTARERWRRWLVDAAERVGWTAAAAAAGEGIVLAADLPQWAAVPVITGLTAVKVFAAAHIGDRSSAGMTRGPGDGS
jgi:hypothetical protein